MAMNTSSNADGTRVETWDVTNHRHGAEMDGAWLETIRSAPAFLTTAERLLLYSLIYCLRPRRYLEIGVLHGGSALIVAKAMDAVKSEGKLILIDPEPQIDKEQWRQIEHRSVLLEGRSPAILGHAKQVAGGPFDFVFVDASHTANAVLRDANGVKPHLAEGAYILFHDAFRRAVNRAIDRFVTSNFHSIVDFGFVTREFTQMTNQSCASLEDGGDTKSCGFRLVQFRKCYGSRLSGNIVRGLYFRCEDLLRWSYSRALNLVGRISKK